MYSDSIMRKYCSLYVICRSTSLVLTKDLDLFAAMKLHYVSLYSLSFWTSDNSAEAPVVVVFRLSEAATSEIYHLELTSVGLLRKTF